MSVRTPNLPLKSNADFVLTLYQVAPGVYSDARVSLDTLAARVRGVLGPSYATRAELYADLAWAAGILGYVWDDPTPALDGTYKKSGASGAGAWARIGDLPKGQDGVDGLDGAQMVSDLGSGVVKGYAAIIIDDNGNKLIGERDIENWALGISASSGASLSYNFGGTAIHRAQDADATSSVTQYPGDWYRGCLWLRNARLQIDNTVICEVNWDKTGLFWEDVVFNSNGVVVTTTMRDTLSLTSESLGQSLGQGGAAGAVITTTAIDTGNLRMIDITAAVSHPYLTNNGIAAAGLEDLRHSAIFGSAGETHLGGMGRGMMDALAANGFKIPMVVETMALGGHSLYRLSPVSPGYQPAGAYGAQFADAMRGSEVMRRIPRAEGRTIVNLPIPFIHGEADSGRPGLTAIDYRDHAIDYAIDINKGMRLSQGWHPDAPDTPLLPTQCAVTPAICLSGSTRLFRRDLSGPMLAQWALYYKNPRLMLPVVPSYDLPDSDATHLTARGYFILGERVARRMAEYSFGKYKSPLHPEAVNRTSNTSFYVDFGVPTGSLVFDVVAVAEALDGNKGFVMWDAVTGNALTITSVVVTSAKRLTFTHPAAGSGNWSTAAEPWLDYALWKDVGYGGSRSPTQGPRGNLRTDAGYTSTIVDYGEAAHTDRDWCPGFRCPVPFQGSSGIYVVEGRL